MERPHILVVCGRNKKRSRTAEYIFKNDNRFSISSAGLSPQSAHKISERDIKRADLIFVMETDQKKKIKELYPYLKLPLIEVLDIADEYDFMDEELIQMLEAGINNTLHLQFNI